MCSSNKWLNWKKVHDSLNWQLSYNSMLEHVNVIFLSFIDLPFYLMHSCMYYCVFYDGFPIKRKTIESNLGSRGVYYRKKKN